MEARTEEHEHEPFGDLDEFTDWIHGYVDHMVASWDAPDDDLMPTFATVNGAGQIVVYGFAVPLTEEFKEMLGRHVFPSLIRGHDANRFAWATSTWMIPPWLSDEKRARYYAWRAEQLAVGNTSIQHAPGRVEALNIVTGEWTGEQRVEMCQLFRRKSKPPRAKWLAVNDGEVRSRGNLLTGEGMTVSGRLVTDVMRALMGTPTADEYEQVVRSVSRDDEVRDTLARLFAASGLTVEELLESGANDPAILAKMGAAIDANPDAQQLLVQKYEERVGPSGAPKRDLDDLT